MYVRKSAPGVRNGTVQKKNNHTYTYADKFVISRNTAWRGYRHVVTKRDVHDFLEIVPDWEHGHHGVECIHLSGGSKEVWGSYKYFYDTRTGIIILPAWHKEFWFDINAWYFEKNRYIFEKLRLSYDRNGDDYHCRFTTKKAKAFMLLHVFLHELGHHLDRMNTKARKEPVRGEEFADQYADQTCERIWDAYCDRFGQP
ncbi:hypothetical protein PDESU_05123 [Pontiella desulfatans]|uniref:Uncharacterized protein n=1 Tax=Pontiella desulfatans TaxID=2750659 RepID=A0A6C2U8U2_PONDE|nr:hypothetical protein [Pontiella desulfatans]VGO16532.1 hypothetical protein PDESU_05123 [Pontiella desulfatans]